MQYCTKSDYLPRSTADHTARTLFTFRRNNTIKIGYQIMKGTEHFVLQ